MAFNFGGASGGGGGGGFNFGGASAAGTSAGAGVGAGAGAGGFNFGGAGANKNAGGGALGGGWATFGGLGGAQSGALVPTNTLGQRGMLNQNAQAAGAFAGNLGQGQLNYDLHHLSFEKLKQRGGGNLLIDELIKRVNATQRLVDDVDNAARNIKVCSLPMQLERLSELKGQVYDAALAFKSVENERKRQETAVSGRRGLKEELKVFSRDQRYASISARNLEQNFTSRIAPTDFFERLYASLCEQMNELQQQIYEVESIVNPESFRASVARDRNTQLRRKKWAMKHRDTNDLGIANDNLDTKSDQVGSGTSAYNNTLMSVSQAAMLRGNNSFSSKLSYNVEDAVRHLNHVAYGRGVESAEQGAVAAHRARMLANRRRRVGASNLENAGRMGASVDGRGSYGQDSLVGGRMSAGTLERVLQSQYRSFLDTAARVAKVHEIVKKMRNEYLEAINSPEGGARERAIMASAVGVNSRREMNRIGANKLRSRPYGIDPFADANERELKELQKQARRRQEEVYRGLAKASLEKQRAFSAQGSTPSMGSSQNASLITGTQEFKGASTSKGVNSAAPPTSIPIAHGFSFGGAGGANPAASPAANPAGGFSFGGAGGAKPAASPAANPAGGFSFGGAGGAKPAGGFSFGTPQAPGAGGGGGFKF